MTKTTIEKIMLLLKSNRIFKNTDEKILEDVINNYGAVASYPKGEQILKKGSSGFLCLIIKGEARVSKAETVISHLNEGDIYGAPFLYNKISTFSNVITTLTPLKVLIIEKKGIDLLIETDKHFAFSYIEYLSERISFLNGKIEGYTKPSAEEKLLLYLENNIKQDDNCYITVPMTELSDVLGISRASLYRVMDNLAASGKISRDGKKIKLQTKVCERK